MLVLSRKSGETIQIGPDVSITVVKIGPNAVRLGIEAAPEMAIVRGEIAEQIQAAEQETSPLKIFEPTDRGKA